MSTTDAMCVGVLNPASLESAAAELQSKQAPQSLSAPGRGQQQVLLVPSHNCVDLSQLSHDFAQFVWTSFCRCC